MTSVKIGRISLLAGFFAIGCSSPLPPVPQPVVPPAGLNAVEALPPVIVNACDWDHAIYLDKKDSLTDATAQAIDQHNTDGAKRCGWKPKSK